MERTRELTLLNEQLAEAKLTADAASVGKTRFLAAASHDLLQPLHVARILTGALAERSRSRKTLPLVSQLDQALGAIDALLQTLLEISKLDAGALRPQTRCVNIGEVLGSVAASFEPMAHQRGIELRVVGSSAVVVTDPALLRRILQNFLSNAVRYTRAGKVLLGCRHRHGRLVVEVWDTGVGIPEDQLSVIFEEFRRGSGNDSDTPPGLGLGLAIVDRIAKMLGHPVSVRSWLGRGSVFSVTLPAGATAVPVAPLAVEARIRNTMAGKIVLCVDNEPSVLVAMRTLLDGWSCDVLVALNLMTARRELRDGAIIPDLILMDYHLEGDITGLSALDALSRHFGKHVPAILVTANHTDVLREVAEASGYAVLHEPVRPGALRALMTQMLATGTPRGSRRATGSAFVALPS
jgi:CheY-like chemotaxis protein